MGGISGWEGRGRDTAGACGRRGVETEGERTGKEKSRADILLVASRAGAAEAPKKPGSSSGRKPLQALAAIGWGIGWAAFIGDVVT